jgi:transposase
VVCEATGGYERKLLDFLFKRQIPVSLINPVRLRAFARSEGVRAKTDPIDTRMIMRFAHEKNPPPTLPLTPVRQQLVALLDRRSHLTEQLAREKNRIHRDNGWIKAYIERAIVFVQNELKRIDEEIESLIESDAKLQEQSKRMQSVKGVGKITAWTLLAYLPELEHLGRNQVVALAGLAPFNRDSGKFKGRRRIQAGRAKVRRCLYMAAQTAAQHNDVIKAYVEGLVARGKHYKMAMVAAMRKLLIHLQSIIREDQKCLV